MHNQTHPHTAPAPRQALYVVTCNNTSTAFSSSHGAVLSLMGMFDNILDADRVDILVVPSRVNHTYHLPESESSGNSQTEFPVDEDSYRVCSVCGAKMMDGYTDEWDFYACSDECLNKGMDEDGLPWGSTPEENDEGGYYHYINPDGTTTPLNIYWTQWC